MYNWADLMAARPVVGRKIKIVKGRELVWLTPVEKLPENDVLRVLPGERIPLDGVVISGESCVSRRITARGAHELKAKRVGDKIYCGTINAGDIIEIRVTADWRHSGFEQKLELAREELDKQPLLARMWRRLSGAYSPSYN